MNKKYWLIGGIIGAIIAWLYLVEILSGFSIFKYIFLIPSLFVWGFGGGDNISQPTGKILMYLILIPYGFILGAIIGWIYGKIKKMFNISPRQ